MEKVNYFSKMVVRPDDLNTDQAYFEERIDTNMGVLSNKGVVVDATMSDGTVLRQPYVWFDTKSLGVYGLVAFDEFGKLIVVSPKKDSQGSTLPSLSNLTPDESGKLVENGSGSFGINREYVLVIRYNESFTDQKSVQVNTNILLPSRIERSFDLYIRDSNSALLSGDVRLATVKTDSSGLLSVDEGTRDEFQLINSLLKANVVVNGETVSDNISFEDHINMGGSGVWSPSNPHRYTAEDFGIDVAATGKHQRYLHSDGIKTDNVKSTTSALYPYYSSSSLTSEEKLYIEPLSESNNEIVVVNGDTITPSMLGSQYSFDFKSLVSEEYEGFYIFAVNNESKSIVMQGPYASEDDYQFINALNDRTNFPICSLHWGRPYYVLYNISLQSADNNASVVTQVFPSTYEFINADPTSSGTILAKDLVVKSEVTDASGNTLTTGTVVTYNGTNYWVISKTNTLQDPDRYDIDPLSFRDRRVFNNTGISDIRREDLCAIRDAAPISNNTVSLFYSRVVSNEKLSYYQVGGSTLILTIDGNSFEYTFLGESDLTKDQVIQQLNDAFESVASTVKPYAFINYDNKLTIVASKSIIVGDGSANTGLKIDKVSDMGEDIKTICYSGELPSIQEMYYDNSGNISKVYYLTEGNYIRSHEIGYSEDYVTNVIEKVVER